MSAEIKETTHAGRRCHGIKRGVSSRRIAGIYDEWLNGTSDSYTE